MSSFNENKFKEVLHYIIYQCGSLDHIGKTVLYKLLYFTDFDYYELFEKHLTGEDYYSLPHGPAPSHFNSTIRKLKEEGLIREVRVNYHGHTQNKFKSIIQPELLSLNPDEKTVLDKTIKKLCNMNATQISAYSHMDMPWKAAKLHEKLDYELVFYRNRLMSVVGNTDD